MPPSCALPAAIGGVDSLLLLSNDWSEYVEDAALHSLCGELGGDGHSSRNVLEIIEAT
jgi:hypothetical protein